MRKSLAQYPVLSFVFAVLGIVAGTTDYQYNLSKFEYATN